MKTSIRNKAVVVLIVLFLCIIACFFIKYSQKLNHQETQGTQETPEIQEIQETKENYVDCVVGLLSDGNDGSRLVAFETDDWSSTTLLDLPEVTPDNYAAVSSDGKYIAYTTWDMEYLEAINVYRRYLMVYSTETGEETAFYRDIPVRNEVVDISWMPDNKTVLFVLNDKSMGPIYSEIRTLNIETGAESTLVRGEAWQVREINDAGKIAEDFYLKGAQKYLPVQYIEPTEEGDCWNYYLTQSDLDEIYAYYGGVGQFSITDAMNYFYVQFSRPRISADGNSILYSATLTRTSAKGAHTPLWMCSAIWEYNLADQTSAIAYAQTDGGAIGRVDWVDDHHAAFVAYYDFQGSRDSINLLDLSDHSATTLFPYTDEHYNNVTLLSLGGERLSFTSSEKDASFEESVTMVYDLSTEAVQPMDVSFDGSIVLLEKFVYTRLVDRAVGYS